MKKITLTSIGILLLSSGCGPVVPLEVAMRQALITVFAGHHQPTPEPSLPSVYAPPPVLNLGFASGAPLPMPSTPPPCPELNEFAVVKDPATALIPGPPPMANYVMRSSGSYSFATASGTVPTTSGKLPASLALVQPAQPKAGTDQVNGTFHDYSLITVSGPGAYTAYGFRLAPDNPATPGILLTSLHWKDSVRGDFDFVPDQPLQFLPTPVAVGNTWSSAGSDPIDETSIQLNGSVSKRETVNACGVALDSFQVQISGTIVSPTFQLSWTAAYDIGTQFGGLILKEDVTLSGPDSVRSVGDIYTYKETSIIDNEPEFPH
jgi:hypothetical protein